MANSRSSTPVTPRLSAIHALGHPNSPPPQTRWAQPAHGRAGWPAMITAAAPTPPNAPTAPVLSQGAGTAVVATWTSPATDETHSAATIYNLRYSPAGAGTWIVASAVLSPYTIGGLAGGASFDVEVQAANTSGSSAWSPAATLATSVAAPNAPTVSSVIAPPDGTAGKLVVTWPAPGVDGSHGAATGYNLRYSAAGASVWTVLTSISSPCTLTGLTGGAALDVQVQAINAASSPSAWSATNTATPWGATVAPGNWSIATTQVHNASVAPYGGANLIATPNPTAVTGAVFAWSTSATTVPTAGFITAAANGQTNGWGQWFNAPATAGAYYLWMLARGAGSTTIGALVTGAITVT